MATIRELQDINAGLASDKTEMSRLVSQLNEQLTQAAALVEELTRVNEELRIAGVELKKQLSAEITHNDNLRHWAEQSSGILSAALGEE